jgi:hypothetical protein
VIQHQIFDQVLGKSFGFYEIFSVINLLLSYAYLEEEKKRAECEAIETRLQLHLHLTETKSLCQSRRALRVL